jgi:hypothetical protein
MDIARLSTKYANHRVEDDALIAAHRRGGIDAALAQAVEHAAEAVRSVESELAVVTSRLHQSASKVKENLGAEPGQPVFHLNPLGELQANGTRFDALIAMRADRIGHLQQLIRLWRHLPAHTVTTPAT